jgi:hypothetical protein
VEAGFPIKTILVKSVPIKSIGTGRDGSARHLKFKGAPA